MGLLCGSIGQDLVWSGFVIMSLYVREIENKLQVAIWPPKHRNMVYLGPYLRSGGHVAPRRPRVDVR